MYLTNLISPFTDSETSITKTEARITLQQKQKTVESHDRLYSKGIQRERASLGAQLW